MMKKMLVVEDDVLSRDVLDRIFKSEYQIDYCFSGETFRQFIADNVYDVIIMDIALQGKENGLDLTRELKSDPVHSKTPIVCLTALAFKRDKEAAMRAGVDTFIVKPVANNVLRERVAEMVKEGLRKGEVEKG
ncbi:MAG: response regulator [Melioribacteraceae bacterium]|nr:response regulator [Melioribacteraceae bacterium]MDZ7767367.1 response regulator [Melioribacteraceae bacterium]